MLQTKVIEPETLDLLKRIQAIKEFKDLRLVGGTALALQYGHRKSIDLDFFGRTRFSDISFENILTEFASVKTINSSDYIKQYSINNVKVDFVSYPYEWLQEPIEVDDIKLATSADIAAMKLSAITNRGTKKDFVDLYFLLNEFSLAEMLAFYDKKYPDGSTFLVLKSLIYFDDAEDQSKPFMFETIKWERVKEKIIERHSQYLENLL